MGKTYRKSPFHEWQKEKKEYRREHYRKYRKATKQLTKIVGTDPCYSIDDEVVFDNYLKTSGRLTY